jgi:antagonist of KipI
MPIHLIEPKQYVSSAVTMGTLQLLPSGQIIVLMADHQTIGGYANLGQIILVDLPRLAQLNNQCPFKLSITNVQTAHQLYRSIQSWFMH